jgi:hypothetical protein
MKYKLGQEVFYNGKKVVIVEIQHKTNEYVIKEVGKKFPSKLVLEGELSEN